MLGSVNSGSSGRHSSGSRREHGDSLGVSDGALKGALGNGGNILTLLPVQMARSLRLELQLVLETGLELWRTTESVRWEYISLRW